MSAHKSDIASLRQSISDENIQLDFDPYSGGLRRTQKELANLEFETTSPCGNIAVYMGANQTIKDLVLHDKALNRMDHRQMAKQLTETIQRAEQVAADGINSALRYRSGTGSN